MWQAQVAVTYQSKQTDAKLLRLLMVFADKADENGRVDPAPNQDTLAELFSVSDRTIRSWINLLIDSGELIRTRRGRGDGNASAYQINLNIPQGGQVTGSYTEENPAFASGNLEERLGSLEEVIARILPVIENLREEQEAITGRTGSDNGKEHSCKGADDPSLIQSVDPVGDITPPTPPQPEKPTRKGPPTAASAEFPYQNGGCNPEPSPADLRLNAILDVCGLDASVPRHVTQAANAAAQLSRYTAAFVQARYGRDLPPGDSWQWYYDDFRGREGQQPTVGQLIETIARQRGKVAKPSPNGHNPNDNDIEAMKARVAAKLQEVKNASQLAH